MAAYKFILGLIFIVVLGFVAIPITSIGTEVGGIFNNMTTDTSVLATNAMYLNILYVAFPVIIIAIFAMILREDKGD